MTIVTLETVDSTNHYCEILDPDSVEDFTIVWALQQTAGRGQRGNLWDSGQSGENLTFSLFLKPTFLSAASQFKLTEMLSLAVADWLAPQLPAPCTPSIKWPNDVYVGGRKICGMLVSNRLAGPQIATSICGIGVNINKIRFGAEAPNGTSLRLLTGQAYSRPQLEGLMADLAQCLDTRYQRLRQGEDFHNEYLSLLYRRGVAARYRYLGTPVVATLTGTDAYGHLLLVTADGQQLQCSLKELVFE